MTPTTNAGQHESADKTAVAKAVLYGAGGFISTIATILVVAGTWQIDNGVTRLALVTVGVIAALALFVAAFIVRR